jgi:23S rRNA (cytosine1962-C5)-methyltransferase
VTRDAERQIRAGHPWVFDRSLRAGVDGGRPGDLAVIFDHDRRFLAVGLYDPGSPIRVRVLHQGQSLTIDDRWLVTALARTVDHRRPLIDSADTNAFRLVHGENDGLGGLVVDVYGDSAVIKIYSEAWIPWLPYVQTALLEQPLGLNRLVLRHSRGLVETSDPVDDGDGRVIHGPLLDGPVTFVENGLRFRADLLRGHKTGHFLDQRDNRQLIRELSDGKRVLDVFACTGGFSVHAAAGGAAQVTSVDVSGPALDLARANVDLNRTAIPATVHRTVIGDAFDVLERFIEQGRRFDLVILDPPAFAQRKNQIDGAVRAYRRLARLGAGVTETGGQLFQASCSSRVSEEELAEAVRAGIERSGRRGRELRRTGQPLDHPIGFVQGAYLKAVLVAIG